MNKNTTCLQIVQKPSGDTLVKGNIMNGLYYKNFNFISVTEKYLQGHNSLNSKLLITIYTNYDSSNQKVDAYVLKTYSCNTNYIDYISWIRDEKPKIEPSTGAAIMPTANPASPPISPMANPIHPIVLIFIICDFTGKINNLWEWMMGL